MISHPWIQDGPIFTPLKATKTVIDYLIRASTPIRTDRLTVSCRVTHHSPLYNNIWDCVVISRLQGGFVFHHYLVTTVIS